MKYSYRVLFFVLLLAGAASCNKETETPGDDGAAFFPLQKDHYVVYQTDSTLWDDFTRTVTQVRCQLRYTVADTFRDLQGNLAYNMIVDVRSGDTAGWSRHSAFYAVPVSGGLDYVENNLRFRKLVFPVSEGRSWDGNTQIVTTQPALQHYAGWKYQYTDLGKTYSNGLRSFDNTVSVPQVDVSTGDDTLSPQDYADRTFSKEVYAKGVGLIDREFEHWIYDRGVSQLFFRKGFAVRMRAIEHN